MTLAREFKNPVGDKNAVNARKNSAALYRRLWRWHFYAGLFCIPFVLLLALSGAVYLFKPYYEHWAERDYRNLAINGDLQLPNAQIAAAVAAVPASKFLTYRLPEAPTDAVQISVQAEQTWLVYVNPYSLAVMAKVEKDKTFMQWVKHLHGELLLGNLGTILVELAACWAIVLVLTGVYLWWPRATNNLAGVIYPRWREGSRKFWRDLHAVTGIWISILVLFLLVSGLPWALVWGSALKEIRASVAGTGVSRTASAQMLPENKMDWTLNSHEEHMQARAGAVTAVNLTPAMVAQAQKLSLEFPVELSENHGDGWKVSSQTQNRVAREDVWLSAQGAIEKRKSFAQKPLVDRAIGIGIAAHEGQLFGGLNLLLGLVAALGLMVLAVSGLVLWWKRKPSDSLGAPAIMPVQLGRGFLFLIVLLALCLPLFALSLMIIAVLEFALLRYWLSARSWLGLVKPS